MSVWDRLFNRKTSATNALIVENVGPGKPVYTQRNYEALARDGFNSNIYVYRAISEIAKASAGIPWKLFKEGRKLTEITQHPILDLLRKPNNQDGAASFWKKAIGYYYMSGNMYVEAVRPLTRTAPPLELWTQRPDRMRVIPDATRGVSGYEYRVGNRAVTIDAINMLHMKMFNPVDDYYGLSPVVVAAKIVDQMAAANDWNTALFQNGGRPDGVFQTAARLDPDQRETLRTDMRRLYSGPKNARRPLILESGLTWTQLGGSPADMDWLAGKVVQGREIAIAIGVAPELLGDAANKTYSNVAEARSALYYETVIPLMHEIRDALNTWLVLMYGDDSLRLDIDISGITALQEDASAKRTFALQGLQAGLLTLNAALKMVGEEEIEQGDVRFLPSSVVVTPTEKLIPEDEDDEIYPLPYMLPAGNLPPQLQAPSSLPDDINADSAYVKRLADMRAARVTPFPGVTIARPVGRQRPKRKVS